MAEIDKIQLSEGEKEEAIFQRLQNLPRGLDKKLIRQHAEAGVSMYGTDPRYPGEMVEIAPDGKWFIVKREGDKSIRLREVSPRDG